MKHRAQSSCAEVVVSCAEVVVSCAEVVVSCAEVVVSCAEVVNQIISYLIFYSLFVNLKGI
jgi:hypothetical protein